MTAAIRFKSTVGSDHTIRLPAEVPEGPVEIIVLVEAADDDERRLADGAARRLRAMGSAAGRFTVPQDFDEPLPPDLLR